MEDIGSCVNLPPGFRFCPTDEELVLQFLYPKAFLLPNCHPNIIPDVDLQLHNPWDFNGSIALSSGNMYYFFSKVLDHKVTPNGYWKELDKAEPIVAANSGNQVGVKRCLVFYVGEFPVGVETDWVMEEFSLCNNIGLSSSSTTAPAYKRRRKQNLDCKWVLCRVHERKSNTSAGSGQTFFSEDDNGTELSGLDEMFFSLLDDDLDEISMQH